MVQVRDAVASLLDAWATIVPAERLIPNVADVLVGPKTNADAKAAGLKWIANISEDGRAARCLDAAIKAAAVGVCDKAPAVRECGHALITVLVLVSPKSLKLAGAVITFICKGPFCTL